MLLKKKVDGRNRYPRGARFFFPQTGSLALIPRADAAKPKAVKPAQKNVYFGSDNWHFYEGAAGQPRVDGSEQPSSRAQRSPA